MRKAGVIQKIKAIYAANPMDNDAEGSTNEKQRNLALEKLSDEYAILFPTYDRGLIDKVVVHIEDKLYPLS